MKNTALLLSLALFAPAASAKPPRATIDPAVDSVVSGGYWTDGEDRGTYRVVVRSDGFDHIVSEIRSNGFPIRGARTKARPSTSAWW